jgi:hypothetical protein
VSASYVGIEVVPLLGEYRLAYRGAFIGTDTYGSSDVLALGDEVCEREGVDHDSTAYVFSDRHQARSLAGRITHEVLRFRHGQ